MYTWDALKRQCEISKEYCWQLQNPCLNPEFPQEQLKKSPCSENLSISSWSYDMEGHARNVWNDTVSWQTKRLNSSISIYSMHWWPSLQRRIEIRGTIVNVCSQIVLKCLYLARNGRPDILWSVNKFARSITKWTKACDKRLSRLISYIHYTSEYKQILSCGKHCQNNADWDCFKTQILQDILKIQNPLLEERCASLEATRLCQLAGCVRNNLSFEQLNRIRNLFLGRRFLVWTVYPRLTCGIWSFTVLHRNRNQRNKDRATLSTSLTRKNIHGKIDDLNSVDFVSSNANSSHKEAMLYIFEDNEAVIKMIIKGRSPNNATCFQNPQSCSRLVIRSNQFGPQDPNQIHWHQEPTRRHTDKGKFHTWHTWWVEPSFVVFVQH